MDGLVIVLAFQEPGKRPVSIASVNDCDCDLLDLVAQMALKEAVDRVADLAESNPIMAKLQAAELERLRTALALLLPGFQSRAKLAVDCTSRRRTQ
jgi:hypothetical protein